LDAISDLALFRAIVDAGGISAAALVLQSSPAAVSRRLTALEAKLGIRLADRSSRRFRLTDEGLLLYERSRSILEQIRDAEAEVASRGGAARGLLKVGAPCDFGRRHLGPILALFTAQHPGLEAHLVLSDAGLENQADACDLVLRFGLPNDPEMIARKIATTTRVVCAAPSYLALGAFANVFAIESFMDELAELAECDPVEASRRSSCSSGGESCRGNIGLFQSVRSGVRAGPWLCAF
jgi:DNA-binding transcriptional LysR family regulator